jgi:hypothetical protein
LLISARGGLTIRVEARVVLVLKVLVGDLFLSFPCICRGLQLILSWLIHGYDYRKNDLQQIRVKENISEGENVCMISNVEIVMV